MTNPNDTENLDSLLCFNAYALNRAFGRFYQAAFSETGLTYPKFVILMALDENGAMTVSELSARAGVEPQTLSPLLKKMQGFGVLTRTRAAEDERRVFINLTDMGRALLNRARGVVFQGYAELGLDPRKMREALQFLEDARRRVEQAEPPKLDIKDIAG